MPKHNDAMKTSGHSLLEKYTSHFIERVVCERELETELNCNILTPTLMAITAFLSRSPGLLNGDLGAQPFCDMFLIPASSLQLQLLNRGPAWCWFSLQYLIFNWLELPVHRVILLFYAHSIQLVDSQGYPLETFDRMHLLFPILIARPGSICNKS